MNWMEQPHPGEILVEWGAPALLAAASGWSASVASGNALAGLAALVGTMAVGVFAMRRADQAVAITLPEFAVESIDRATDDALLLDDALIEPAADSRVVSMFEPERATPGALVARIADYLGDPGPHDRPVAADAADALQAALANIRASLR